MSESLKARIGVENDLPQVAWSLRQIAQGIQPAVVGALQITCSDEAEWECTRVFQSLFVEPLLPGLKPDSRAPFRSVNFGGRYEEGTVRLADQHFATPEAERGCRLLVVKLNSHVGVRTTAAGLEYGVMSRYQRSSPCCGALSLLLEGARLPALDELAAVFGRDGKDRLALLRDSQVVPPAFRAVLAAVVNARLQAQRVVEDIQKQAPETPTVYLVVPCVTVNSPGPDTEIVVGQCAIDWTGPRPSVQYQGLGDDPAAMQVRLESGRLRLSDDQWSAV